MKHARADYDRIQDPANIIPEDEPVFLLRASDTVAPDTVRSWAMRAKSIGASDEIVKAAVMQASRMDAWQIQHSSKVPDMPSK